MMLRPAIGAIWPRKRSTQNDNQNEKQDSVHVAGPSRIVVANVMRDAGFLRRSVSDRSQQGARVLANLAAPEAHLSSAMTPTSAAIAAKMAATQAAFLALRASACAAVRSATMRADISYFDSPSSSATNLSLSKPESAMLPSFSTTSRRALAGIPPN